MARRTTTDASPVRWHIFRLQKLRGRRPLSRDDRLCALRVFYGLNAEAHEMTKTVEKLKQ